ncbi:transcriptional regulator [Streptomyces sp. NPDC048637]|uniref:transcriptional regulator n=1 Tax=Streptomyces sp. NPDC048637 TaxID=3155636 RepID=UPI003449AEB6
MDRYRLQTSPKALGYLLTRAIDARGWRRAETARKLRELSEKRGHPLNTGRDGIWYWEHGRTPDRATQLLLAELFGIPLTAVDERPWPEWLSEDPAQRPAPRPWTSVGATQALATLQGGAMDTTRRKLVLIAGGTLTASLLAWITADPAAAGQLTHGNKIGETAVARLEGRVRKLHRMDDLDGGGGIIDETSSALALVSGLLRNRSCTDAHRRRLYAAAADLARQLAAALFDVEGEVADDAFDTALRCAHIAGDTALGANVLAFWSAAAYNTGRLHDAANMASTGLTAVRSRATPRVEALLTSRRGRARAHLGDPACWSDFDRAQSLLAEANGHQDPDWAYWFDEAELLAARASSHHDMGQPASAAHGFAQAHALFDPECVRTRALYLTRQADAYFEHGEIERACTTASDALDLAESISSRRTTEPLLSLAGRLAAFDTLSTREFHDRAQNALTA